MPDGATVCGSEHPWFDPEMGEDIAKLSEGICPACDITLRRADGFCPCCRAMLSLTTEGDRTVITISVPTRHSGRTGPRS